MKPMRVARLLAFGVAMRRREWAAPRRLRAYTCARLQRVVSIAAARVPYYRTLFREAGVNPAEIRAPEDLVRIPISDTRIMRRQTPGAIVVEGVDPGGLVCRRSSGSTGITMSSYLTPFERELQAFYAIRVFRAGGYRVKDLLLDLTEARVPAPRKIERLGLFRKRYLPITDDLARHARAIESMRPDVVLMLANLIEILAEAALKQGLRIRPRHIFTVGEHVTLHQRQLAREVFGVDPIDVYGATEFGPIAFQCAERRGYHVNTDSVILEIVDPHTDAPVAPGEVGKAVVTGLVNETMPLIRYALGDLAVVRDDRCPCGRSLPLLDSIRGRVSQMLFAGDGRRVPPWGPTTVLEETAGVERFQIVQEQAGALHVRIRGGPVDEGDLAGRLRRLFDPGLTVTVEYVDSFGAPEVGKFKKVICRVARPGADQDGEEVTA